MKNLIKSSKSVALLPTVIKSAKGISLAGPSAPAKKVVPAQKPAAATKVAPAKSAAVDPNTDFVTIALPKGTRYETKSSGKNWLIAPLHHGRERWFDLNKGLAAGIKGYEAKKDGTYTVTVRRSALSYRHMNELAQK